jgi:hypothetical protein
MKNLVDVNKFKIFSLSLQVEYRTSLASRPSLLSSSATITAPNTDKHCNIDIPVKYQYISQACCFLAIFCFFDDVPAISASR